MKRKSYLFTSESVTEGHPDKVADQISDAVLDAILEKDPSGRVACETLVTTGLAFVAGEITKNGGIAICAPIAPYHSTRRAVREMIEGHGAFIEIHVATPLEVCESRDRKGLYAKARKGIIPEFTGISDPYETPQNPELRIDTSKLTPMQAAQEVFLYLLREGYLDEGGSGASEDAQ